MLFYSALFIACFTLILPLYYSVNRDRQNWILLVTSYFYYGTWDYRFCFLILLMTLFNYLFGHASDRHKNWRKRIFIISTIFNLGIWSAFKFSGFFIDSANQLVNAVGIEAAPLHLSVILPLGLSFYTFQIISYQYEILKSQISVEKNPLHFALFVSFFPQLLAGPIEKASEFLPQIKNHRTYTNKNLKLGITYFIWGWFQKVFVSNNLDSFIGPIFDSELSVGGNEMRIASVAFMFQHYCDFAGYSNMAKGLAKILGFDLILNFRLPFFSANLSEFWENWHISLSRWIRIHVYGPIVGKHGSSARKMLGFYAAFFFFSLWHGNSIILFVFGLTTATSSILYLAVLPYLNQKFRFKNAKFHSIWFVFRVVVVFYYLMLGFSIFRSPTLARSIELLTVGLSDFDFKVLNPYHVFLFIFVIGFYFLLEIIQYKNRDIFYVFKISFPRQLAYYSLIFCMGLASYVLFDGLSASIASHHIYFDY